MIEYLSLKLIIALHDALLERFGGAPGVRDRSGVESALARPMGTFGGEDLYPDVAAKAAALMHSLARNHPFVDGNKRVAVAAAELFCEVNGFALAAKDDELEALTVAAAAGEIEAEALAIWIRQRLVAF